MKPRHQRQPYKFVYAWLPYWEGIAIYHWLGLIWALAWFAAFLVLAVGIAIGKKIHAQEGSP